MAFSTEKSEGVLCDMNIIPLADVMLVLLIIFMVTAPTPSYPIEINLPQRTLNPPENPREPPPPISLRIDASGQVYWNDSPVAIDSLPARMTAEVQKDPTNQPTLEVDVNADAEYGILAQVLSHAKNADMKKIGFVQETQ